MSPSRCLIPTMRPLLPLTLLVLALPCGAAAEPVLHEYVPPPGRPRLPAGVLPDEISAGDRRLPPPADSDHVTPGEPVLRGPQQRPRQVAPDRVTTHDGRLRYRATFDPSVVPFKRMTAFDAVGDGYRLHIRSRRLVPEPITDGQPAPDSDQFWGSVMVRSTGAPVPLPSVAPQAKILRVKTEPATHVQLFKDSADNVWLRAPRGARFRLLFLTEAPQRYFSPQVPPTARLQHVPSAMRPSLPSAVREAAARVLHQVGVDASMPLHRLLDRMVAYFRNFKPGKLPRITGDAYLDIALSQVGVCRHRSLAFVVTAQALGLPARYVQNDAHAFTEVYIPRAGWGRIDLGGAASELQVSGAERKTIHAPAPDPFPRPTRYATGYSRLNRGVRGVAPSQRLRPRRRRLALARFDRSQGAGSARRRGSTNGAASGTAGAAAGSGPGSVGSGPTPASGPGPVAAPGRDPEIPEQTPTQIAVHTNVSSVLRGSPMDVWGRVTSAGAGAAGLRVELYLSRDGRISDAMMGAVVSDAQGRFSVTLPVPKGIRVGHYRVYAATPGDARRAASISR